MKKPFDKSEISKNIFRGLTILNIFFVAVIGFGLAYWLYVDIKKDSANVSNLFIVASAMYVVHITSKKHRKREKENVVKKVEKLIQTKDTDKKSETLNTIFKMLWVVKIFHILLVFAGIFWFGVEMKKDPAITSILPFFALVLYVFHKYGQKKKEEDIEDLYPDKKSDALSITFKALGIAKQLWVILGLAGAFWLFVEIKKDPTKASLLPFFVLALCVFHITSKEYRIKNRKDTDEIMKDLTMEDAMQKKLPSDVSTRFTAAFVTFFLRMFRVKNMETGKPI